MTDEKKKPTEADMAGSKRRAEALVIAAGANAQLHGKDPVDAVFDLMIAAAAMCQMAGAKVPVGEVLRSISDDAVGVAECWFPYNKPGQPPLSPTQH